MFYLCLIYLCEYFTSFFYINDVHNFHFFLFYWQRFFFILFKNVCVNNFLLNVWKESEMENTLFDFFFIIHRYFVLRLLNYCMMENMLSWTYKKFITHEFTYLNLYLYYGCECVIEENIFLLFYFLLDLFNCSPCTKFTVTGIFI